MIELVPHPGGYAIRVSRDPNIEVLVAAAGDDPALLAAALLDYIEEHPNSIYALRAGLDLADELRDLDMAARLVEVTVGQFVASFASVDDDAEVVDGRSARVVIDLCRAAIDAARSAGRWGDADELIAVLVWLDPSPATAELVRAVAARRGVIDLRS